MLEKRVLNLRAHDGRRLKGLPQTHAPLAERFISVLDNLYSQVAGPLTFDQRGRLLTSETFDTDCSCVENSRPQS